MLDFSKVHPPADSNFDCKRAIELANLIMVAYDEYEIWDKHGAEGKKLGAPDEETILGSSALVNLDKYRDNRDEDYGRINASWDQASDDTRLAYKRVTNFWYSQTSGEDFFEDVNDVLQTDVLKVWEKLSERMNKGADERWALPRLGMRDQVFGFIAERELEGGTHGLFLVFRGTRENAEWFNNFRVGPLTFLENDQYGQVRNGFYRIYNKKRGKGDRETIRTTIETYFNQYPKDKLEKTRIFITGHSLGAGLAILAAAHLVKKVGINPILYTFASPRVGDEAFSQSIAQLQEAYRIINSEDLIQAVPLPTTLILDDEMLKDNSPLQKFVGLARETIEEFTGGLTDMTYQHVGVPVGFTKQTGTVAGNHNLGSTYRNALNQ
ncbi:lipase family protein [Adonisia turfae]|nr:lipase family protein [Adonisia turfae]